MTRTLAVTDSDPVIAGSIAGAVSTLASSAGTYVVVPGFAQERRRRHQTEDPSCEAASAPQRRVGQRIVHGTWRRHREIRSHKIIGSLWSFGTHPAAKQANRRGGEEEQRVEGRQPLYPKSDTLDSFAEESLVVPSGGAANLTLAAPHPLVCGTAIATPAVGSARKLEWRPGSFEVGQLEASAEPFEDRGDPRSCVCIQQCQRIGSQDLREEMDEIAGPGPEAHISRTVELMDDSLQRRSREQVRPRITERPVHRPDVCPQRGCPPSVILDNFSGEVLVVAVYRSTRDRTPRNG